MDVSEFHDIRIIKREVSTKKNHLISVFKSFELNISDKNKKYFDKVPSLLAAWEQIVVFVSESSESPEPEFEYLFLHTLRFVLRAADWRHVSNATKTHLKITLQRFIKVIKNSKKRLSILSQCDVLESVINEDPWGHPILQKIIRDEDIEDLDDLIQYFHFENGKVIVVRLEMLLESKCEDWAARLAKYFLMTCNNTHPLEVEVSQNELDYINDIYFCSLYKTKTKTDLISEIKTFDLTDGLQLLKRYKKHNGVAANFNDYCKNARVWKYSKKVVELISSTLLANAVLHDELVDSDALLNDLIQEWASIHSSSLNEAFSPVALEMIRKYVLIARSSKCIYPFCSFLINNCNGKEYDLDQVIRCLIRAVNQNMNEIEQYRVSRDHEKLKVTYDQLSRGFVLISELFRDYKNIYKECLLTSFSLTPSRECIHKLEEFVQTTLNANKKCEVDPLSKTECKSVAAVLIKDSEGKENPLNKRHDENGEKSAEQNGPILNEIFKNFVFKQEDVNDTKLHDNYKENDSSEVIKSSAAAYFAEVESLKLDESIKTDMNSILRYQRYHTLTWDCEWKELKVNCEKYLKVFEQRGFDEVELKYLELDYNQFKNRPIDYDDYCGIEKGYEHYIVSSEESEVESSYNRRSGYSSNNSDFEDDYGRRKRKKPRSSDEDRKKKTKKKRIAHQPKLKLTADDVNDLEFRQFKVWQPGCEKETESSVMRKENIALDDSEVKIKRKRGRPRKYPLPTQISDNNIDSQSENQPPNANSQSENKNSTNDNSKCESQLIKDEDMLSSDDNVLENISNTKSSPNNLQMLRQFRINVSKSLTNEETKEQYKIEDDSNKTENNVIFEGNHILKICIPKCDNFKLNRTLTDKIDNENINSEHKYKLLTNRNTPREKKQQNKINQNENFKRPKPRSSVTLPHPTKSLSILKQKKLKYQIRNEKAVRTCEVRLPKISDNDLFGITNGNCDSLGDIALENIDNVLDVSSINSNIINEAINNYNSTQKSSNPIDDLNNELFSCLNDIFPEDTNSTASDSFELTIESPKLSQISKSDISISTPSTATTVSLSHVNDKPEKNLSCINNIATVSSFSSQKSTFPPTFVIKKQGTKTNTARLKIKLSTKHENSTKQNLLLNTASKIASTTLNNEITVPSNVSVETTSAAKNKLSATFSPIVVPVTVNNISQFKLPLPLNSISSRKINCTNLNVNASNLNLSSKNSTICGSVSNAVQSVGVSSSTSSNYRVSNLSNLVTSNIIQDVLLPVESSAVPNASYVCVPPVSSASVQKSCSSTSVATYTSIANDPFSSSSVASNTSLTRTHGINSSQYIQSKSDCKLRAALQKPVEKYDNNLYKQTHSVKQPIKENNVAAVHQILGAYQETMNKFPELGHVPAPRNRSNNINGLKRQRKSKKEIEFGDISMAVSMPMINLTSVSSNICNNVKTDYAKTTAVTAVHHNQFVGVNVVQPNQKSIVYVPQTNLPTNRVMQSNKSNVNVPSDVMQKLPTYVSTGVSSQNYDNTERKNVVNSYINVNQQPFINKYTANLTNNCLVNNVQQQNVILCNTNVPNNILLNDSALMNLDNINLIKNEYSNEQDYVMESNTNSGSVMNNNHNNSNSNEYKMYNFTVNPSTSSANQNSAIINNSSTNFKNNNQLINDVPETNSIMLQTTNSGNVNNEVKQSFLYATVYSTKDSTGLNDPGVCISIPEDSYSDTYVGNCLALIENNSLLGQHEDLYTKNQNDDSTSNSQNVQFLDSNNFLKEEASNYENSVIINMGDLFY